MSARPFLLIGAGHWHAAWHCNALLGAGQRVAAVSDPDPAARARLADGHAGVAAYADWTTALARHGDAVAVVLTPPDETPPVLAALVAAGMPIVLEKPGTVDAAALRPIAEAAARAGLATAVPFVNRLMAFWPVLATLDPGHAAWTHAHFRILAGPPERYRRDGVAWVLERRRFGGGALRNLGIHAADAALTLAAGRPLAIRSAVVSNRLNGLEVEDFAAATLTTDDGRTITLEAGYAMPSETTADKEWRAHGPGWALSEQGGRLAIRTGAGREDRVAPGSAAQYASFGATMAALAAGLPHDGATLNDLVAAQHLVDRLYAAAA